jgi:hypothetical protein
MSKTLLFSQMLDEPFEKFQYAVILIIAFWIVYAQLYRMNPNHVHENKNISFDLFDFGAFSILNQIGVTFGDIKPKSKLFKTMIILQVILFWYVALH